MSARQEKMVAVRWCASNGIVPTWDVDQDFPPGDWGKTREGIEGGERGLDGGVVTEGSMP